MPLHAPRGAVQAKEDRDRVDIFFKGMATQKEHHVGRGSRGESPVNG